jgi:uncharacterized protein
VTAIDAVFVLGAAVGAGTINTVVGSGTLITFPTLLAVGLSPITANVSNTMGLAPGSVAGAYGYRRELSGQRARAARLGTASGTGGVLGAVLLLVLPSAAFDAIVPALVGLGVLLVIIGPWLSAWLPKAAHHGHGRERITPLLWSLTFVTGVYGGYFGAAQGVILIAVFGLLLNDTLQRINGLKNVLAGLTNGIAAVVFAFTAQLNWVAVGLVAVGSVGGAFIGASVGRRLPAGVLRAVVVVVGLAALVRLLTE